MRHKMQRYQDSWMFLLRMGLFVSLFCGFFGVFAIAYPWLWGLSRTTGITYSTFGVLLFCLMSLYGGYAIGRQHSKPIVNNLMIATVLTDVVTYMQLSIMNTNERFNQTFRLANPWCLVCCIVLQLLAIILFTYGGNHLYFRTNPPQRSLIITSSQMSLDKVVMKLIRYRRQYRIQTVLDYNNPQIEQTILQHETVFLYDVPIEMRTQLIEFCFDHQINAYYNLDLADVIALGAQHTLFEDESFLSAPIKNLSFEQALVKRAMDLIVSICAVVCTSPIMLLCAIAIKLEDGGKVLFYQQRCTINGKIFKVYKFRTMSEHDNNDQQSATQNDQRITKVGALLRKYRIDELPQFFNIIKGEMSLVGPRPEMLANVYRYSRELPEFEYRLRAKAGLTGMAQVYGKYNTSPKDKLVLDLLYIQKYRVFSDIKLLFLTLIVFFKSDSTEGFIPPSELDFHQTK